MEGGVDESDEPEGPEDDGGVDEPDEPDEGAADELEEPDEFDEPDVRTAEGFESGPPPLHPTMINEQRRPMMTRAATSVYLGIMAGISVRTHRA